MIEYDDFPDAKFGEDNYIGKYFDRYCRTFLFGQIKKWPEPFFYIYATCGLNCFRFAFRFSRLLSKNFVSASLHPSKIA